MQELRRRQHWLEEVRADGLSLRLAPEDLRADKEVVLAAVKENAYALDYAVLEAVQQFGSALKFASEDLRADKEVVLAAVKQYELQPCNSPPRASEPTRRSSLRP